MAQPRRSKSFGVGRIGLGRGRNRTAAEEVETLLAKLESLGLQSKTGLQGASNQTADYSSMYRAGLVPATNPPSMQPGYGSPGILAGSRLQLTPRRAEKENTPSENSPSLNPRDPNRSESP